MGKGREESIDDKMAERRTEDLEIFSFFPKENCGELRRQEGEARVQDLLGCISPAQSQTSQHSCLEWEG